MKANYKSVIFAVVFGSVCSGSIATASVNKDTTKNSTAVVIANSNQKNFETFVEQNLNKIVIESKDWKIVTNYVTLYNQSASKLTNTTTVERNAFRKAVVSLNNELIANGSIEALGWSKSLVTTARTIEFIWKNDWNVEEPTNEDNNTKAFSVINLEN